MEKQERSYNKVNHSVIYKISCLELFTIKSPLLYS